MNQPAAVSHVPAAARKQIKEANRLIAELNAPPQPPGPQRNSAFQQPPAAAAAPAAPAAAAPPDAPAAAAQPVQAPAPDPVAEANHRYSVLQGKYNAETGRLLGAAQALKDENQRLLEALNQRQAPPVAGARPEDRFDTSMVTPKEREEFGEELVNLMARIAKANSAGEVATLRGELDRLRGITAQTQQENAQARAVRVWALLKDQVPNCVVVNNSQQFVDWLEIPDIMSGRPRKEGLTAAYEAGDGPRVVGIFKRFIEEDSHSGSTPRPAAPAVDQGTLIAPDAGRGNGGEAPGSQGGKIWSESEINDFYSRVQRKRISPEEAKATEADILAALRDGRIRPDRDDRHIANSR